MRSCRWRAIASAEFNDLARVYTSAHSTYLIRISNPAPRLSRRLFFSSKLSHSSRRRPTSNASFFLLLCGPRSPLDFTSLSSVTNTVTMEIGAIVNYIYFPRVRAYVFRRSQKVRSSFLTFEEYHSVDTYIHFFGGVSRAIGFL